MVKIIVDNDKCSGDEICVEICPFEIFKMERTPVHREKPRCVVVNEEKCNACRVCQVNCPEQAITIIG